MKSFPDNGDGQIAVSHKLGIAFICVGKCASTSLKRVAALVDGAMSKCTKGMVETTFSDYFRVAVVRDPLDRLISIWYDKTQRGFLYKGFRQIKGMKEGMSFSEFVDIVSNIGDDASLVDGHFRSMHCFLSSDKSDYYLPDFWLLFDRLSIAWEELRHQIYGLPALPVLNKKKPNDFKSPPVDWELMQTIHKRYCKDIALYHYLKGKDDGTGCVRMRIMDGQFS